MRSPHPNAKPLLLSHGWPGSIVEFAKASPMLLDPTLYGGDVADAFHVVAPSLPGFGFSDKSTTPGYGVQKMALLFDRLMRDLGYDQYVAQGGDWGSMITTCIGAQNLDACQAIHVNMPVGRPTKEEMSNPTAADKADIATLKA
jgi:pimeloyl-ACP methyl ester carboxylesterase